MTGSREMDYNWPSPVERDSAAVVVSEGQVAVDAAYRLVVDPSAERELQRALQAAMNG